MMQHYTLRIATLDDALDIWSVMDICAKHLEHKEQFILDDLAYVKDILCGHGFAVVACDKTDKIVGNLLVKYPGITDENLGYDVFTDCLHIPLTTENLSKVVHMDSASVHPNHRGHNLERLLIAYAETLIDISKHKYSFATVAPNNYASLKSLERNGYQVMVTKEKYHGLMRSIMMKLLKA